MHGYFYALDLGTRTGFAKGRPGEPPRSGAVLLKQKGEHRSVALGNLVAFLQQEFTTERPVRLFTEAPMTLQAFLELHSSEANVRMHHGLHGIVEAMCDRFGVVLKESHNATVRKHFIGRANLGSREATKAAVVARAQLLGLMPRDLHDEDRADALAVHDWACATFGQRSTSTSELYFFNERSPSPDAPEGTDAKSA